MGIDITERKDAEEELAQMAARYRGLLEAAPDAMVVVNQDGEIVLLNLQAERQFGYRRDELLGQQVKNIIPEGFAERLIADGTRTAAEALAQQIGTGIELNGRRKDGTEFPIEMMLSPLESAEGILVTAAIRDISVRKDAEKQLAQADELRFRLTEALVGEKERAQVLLERMLHSGEQERKRLAAEIHDGPVQQLTTLDIRLEMIRDRIASVDDMATGLLSRVQRGLQSCIGDLRRMMVELHPPALRERGLEAALGDYMQTVQRASGVQCQLEYDLPGRLDPDNETTMYRIAQEALSNVIKHANAKEVWVTIRTVDRHVELEVRDDGIGFLFDAGQPLAAKGEHYGLIGMRERAEVIGGTLEIQSTPFAGTTIRVTSPKEATR